MTRSSRTLNRLVIGLLGLGLVVAAALVALPQARDLVSWRPDLADPATLWAIGAGAAVFVILAVAFILTRGGGRTSAALRHDGAEIDTAVVTAVLDETLGRHPDIHGVTASAFVRRGQRIVRVAVTTRRHPDLSAVRRAVASAVERLDRTIGTRLALVVHVTSGVRASLARPARATH